MLKDLKRSVYEANMELWEKGMVIYTWGNVSGIDRDESLVVIKPSGLDYDKMKPEDMVVVDLNGNVVEGKLRPSSDTPTHLVLYKEYKEMGGIVHTHSTWATAFAQAGRGVPAFGTTHADYFFGEVPCTRALTKEEIAGEYEKNTGNVIVEAFRDRDPMAVPGVLVCNHGPFAWGASPSESVYHAVVLDKVAEMAYHSLALNPNLTSVPQHLLDKHYYRKHGDNAYYGQG